MKLWEITPGLYVRGRTNQLAAAGKLATVRERNIRLVVNLWHTPDPDLVDAVSSYVLMPIPDGKLSRASAEDLEALATILARRVRGGEGLLVQCYAGRNRSCFLAALVAMRLFEVSGSAAMELVRQGRPDSLDNPYFEAYLEGVRTWT